MTAPRAWTRPDGTLVVRASEEHSGDIEVVDHDDPGPAEIEFIAHDAPDPSDATPLVAAPKVDGDDRRVDILAAHISGSFWANLAESNRDVVRNGARDLLARLDAAAPVATDQRCASCEHTREHHASDSGECWYSVTRGRQVTSVVCACAAWAVPVAREDIASQDKDGLYERLAAIEHERWAFWQSYLHSKCERTTDGDLVIPAGYVTALERQIDTPYAGLTEGEKASDREQVDRYWHLVAPGPPSVDEIARTIDEALDADFESRMSGGGPVSREDMARDAAERIVELWPAPAQPTEAPDAPIKDRALGGDTRGVLARAGLDDQEVELFAAFFAGRHSSDDSEPEQPRGCTEPGCANPRSHRHEPITDGDEPCMCDTDFTCLAGHDTERMADVALGVLRGGGADGGGEDEEFTLVPPYGWLNRVDELLRHHCAVEHDGSALGEALAALLRSWDGSADERGRQEREGTAPGPEFWGPRGRGSTVARLARAAGVSPDSEDPVGAIEAAIRALHELVLTQARLSETRAQIVQEVSAAQILLHDSGATGSYSSLSEWIEAAIRAGREPEVVTGAEAASLPDNTLLVPCTMGGKPALGHHVRIVQDGAVKMPIPAGHEWLHFLVHRPGPAPAPLQPGDEVAGDRAVTAPIDTTLRHTTAAVVALRTVNGWSLTGQPAWTDPEHHVRVNTWRVVEVGEGGGESDA